MHRGLLCKEGTSARVGCATSKLCPNITSPCPLQGSAGPPGTPGPAGTKVQQRQWHWCWHRQWQGRDVAVGRMMGLMLSLSLQGDPGEPGSGIRVSTRPLPIQNPKPIQPMVHLRWGQPRSWLCRGSFLAPLTPLFPLQGLPGPQGNIGLPGPPGPPGPGVGIYSPLTYPMAVPGRLPLDSAPVSLAGPTGCPRADRTSGECIVPPRARLPPVWVLREVWGYRSPVPSSPPQPVLLPTGGEREAGSAGPGWRAREGWRGRDAREDGTCVLLPQWDPALCLGSVPEACVACARGCRDLQVLLVPRESQGMPGLQGR